jgi:RNA polymerase sigma-70 factor (sigma-E family)
MATPPASFDEFVALNAESLLRTAHLMTLDDGDAEDLVQDCLLKLAQSWNRVGAMDKPVAYARRVLVNLAIRGSKKRARRRAELGRQAAEQADDPTAVDLLGIRDEVLTALGQLAPRQRAVLVLRYFHDYSETQVADALGCTTSTVRSTASRSLAQLRDVIGPAGSQRGATTNERSA